MVSRHDIGREFEPITAVVEPGRFVFFLKATGERNPLYAEQAVAEAAGYRARPIPPTYLFCLEMMDAARPFAFLEDLGIDLATILHAEQGFAYHEPVCIGDTLTFRSRIADVFEKKGGALTFIVQDTQVSNLAGRVVADLKRTVVVRRAGDAA